MNSQTSITMQVRRHITTRFISRILVPLCFFNVMTDLGISSEPKMVISGIGNGEILLNITIKDTIPVFSDRYSNDIENIHIPPIASTFNVLSVPISTKLSGYAYSLEGIYIPGMPNNFTVSVSGVKNLDIGIKKRQGSYENTSSIWTERYTRTWISTQVIADNYGVATIDSYFISPGSYQIKIFGDAAENATSVVLTMTLVKKVMVNGKFNLSINTEGFPSGNYSITAKALNGSLSLDKLAIG